MFWIHIHHELFKVLKLATDFAPVDSFKSLALLLSPDWLFIQTFILLYLYILIKLEAEFIENSQMRESFIAKMLYIWVSTGAQLDEARRKNKEYIYIYSLRKNQTMSLTTLLFRTWCGPNYSCC